jgi:hypothetical protein
MRLMPAARLSSRFLAAAAAMLFAAGSGLLSQTAPASVPASEEFLLLGSPNRGAGEPIVFVNPKDPSNVIVVAMATLNRLPSGEPPMSRGGPGPGGPAAAAAVPTAPAGSGAAAAGGRAQLRIKELSTPDGSRTDIAVTHDGGKTWEFSEDNFRKVFEKNRCSDSFAGAGPDGSLYMGCLAYLNRGGADYEEGYAPGGEAKYYHGGSAIARSADKGKTWSNPVWVHPALSPSLYAPWVHPVFEQASPWDRPFFAADASTGTLYVTGTGPTYTVDPATLPPQKVDPSLPSKGYTGYPPASVSRTRTYIRASHDQARTWGVIYPMDSDEYPGGRGGFSAAHGNLVVAYSASKVPERLNAECPCTVLGASRDDGKTFEYQIVPPLPALPAPAVDPAGAAGRGGRGGGGGVGGGLMLAADPAKAGRYALARQSGQTMMLSVTEDGGKTWLPPVVAARLPDGASFGHRAMKYSPKGDIGLMWKQNYSDRTFDVWSAVSRDGGRSFKAVRVSHAVSPPPVPERNNFGFGDDLSSIDLDGDFLHVVWGDHRSGFLGTWYGRVPLSAY